VTDNKLAKSFNPIRIMTMDQKHEFLAKICFVKNVFIEVLQTGVTLNPVSDIFTTGYLA
jgi:hypothetical protein